MKFAMRIDAKLLRASLVFLVTGFAMFLIMGVLGLMMRLAQAGTAEVPPDRFYQVMTLHGSGMITAVLLAAMGGLAAVLGQYVRLSIRWLAWLGFAIDPPQPYGFLGLPFHRFHMERADV